MEKIKVLFVCIHNSARSQMAEALLNHFYGNEFFAESAGFEAGSLNPFAVEAMKEIGIDISQNTVNQVFDYFKEGRFYSYVVTVCDESNAERCPIFPGVVNRIHWSFPDPLSFMGNDDQKQKFTSDVREQIKSKIDEWVRALANI